MGEAAFGKPQPPEKAEMTSSSLLARLIAVEVSPSLNVSVFLRLRSVLLTIVSTIKMRGNTAPSGSVVSVSGPSGAPPWTLVSSWAGARE